MAIQRELRRSAQLGQTVSEKNNPVNCHDIVDIGDRGRRLCVHILLGRSQLNLDAIHDLAFAPHFRGPEALERVHQALPLVLGYLTVDGDLWQSVQHGVKAGDALLVEQVHSRLTQDPQASGYEWRQIAGRLNAELGEPYLVVECVEGLCGVAKQLVIDSRHDYLIDEAVLNAADNCWTRDLHRVVEGPETKRIIVTKTKMITKTCVYAHTLFDWVVAIGLYFDNIELIYWLQRILK